MWNGKPLGFLAQINLEEVAAFDGEGLLPRNGLLSFFYREDNVTGDQISRVLHFEKDNLKYAIVPQQLAQPDDEIIIVPPSSIQFSPEWTTRDFQWSEIPDWDFDQYMDEFVHASGRVKSVHRMLGHPSLVQDNVFIGAEMDISGSTYEESQQKENGWILLLQLDFQKQDCWFSKCYFVIRSEDLPTFSQARCYYQGD